MYFYNSDRSYIKTTVSTLLVIDLWKKAFAVTSLIMATERLRFLLPMVVSYFVVNFYNEWWSYHQWLSL